MKEIKEIMLPSLCEAFLLFLLFLRDLKHAGWLDSFYYPKEIKEIKEIFIPLGEALSAISALSAGHYYLMHIVFLLSRFLLSRRNKGNSRNYSYRPPRSSFCSFCGTLLSHAHSIFIVPQSSALPLRLSKK